MQCIDVWTIDAVGILVDCEKNWKKGDEQARSFPWLAAPFALSTRSAASFNCTPATLQ